MKKLLICTLLLATAGINMTKETKKESSKHVYAIFANDNVTGLSHKLFEDAVNAFKSNGNTVDTLNLYDHKKEIPFFEHGKDIMEANSFYMDNQKRFLEADTLLIVFPLYWYSVPGILKTWIDMINAWAYRFEKNGTITPLHKVKKMVIAYTSMLSHNALEEQVKNGVEHQLRQTCTFLSINDVSIHHLDEVYSMKEGKVDNFVKELTASCK